MHDTYALLDHSKLNGVPLFQQSKNNKTRRHQDERERKRFSMQ